MQDRNLSKDVELKAASHKLYEALSNHRQTEAISIIDSGLVDINTFFPDSDLSFLPSTQFCDLPVKPIHQTFLHIIINILDLFSVQLLLQQGANPNILNSENQSTLEVLFATIAARIIDTKQSKINRNELDLDSAEKILDLLISFGLDHTKVVWTKPFLEKINGLKQYLEDLALERKQSCELLTYLRTLPKLPIHKNKSWVKRKIQLLQLKFDIKKLESLDKLTEEDHRRCEADRYIRGWVLSTSQSFETLDISSREVQLSRQTFLATAKKDIEESMTHSKISLPFIFIILEYAQTEFDIAMRIAEIKFKKSNRAYFLAAGALEAFDNERYKNILIYTATLQSVLPTFEQGIFRDHTFKPNDIFETISEYAVDETFKENQLRYA